MGHYNIFKQTAMHLTYCKTAMSPILLAIFVCSVVSFAFYYWGRRRINAFASLCSYPLYIPIIGHALYLIGNGEDIFKNSIKCGRVYPGKRVFLWIFSRPVFLVQTPEDAAVVLNSPHCIAKSVYYDAARLWLGNGIFTAPTKTWSVHRKMFVPGFNKRMVDLYTPAIIKSSVKFTSDLATFAENRKPFDIHEYLTAFAFRSFCEGAMGLSCVEAVEGDATNFHFTLEKIKALVNDMIFNFRSSTYYTRGDGKEFSSAKETMRGFVKKVLLAKKKELARAGNPNNKVNNHPASKDVQPQDLDSNGLRPLRSFLDLLLDITEESFSPDQLYDEINTFLFGGIDTTATTIGYALLVLGMCKDIQQLVHDELDNIFSDRNENEPIRMSDLPQMTYLTRVIKETMRMYPVSVLIGRYSEADITLSDGVILPAGIDVVLLVLSLHRNPELWKNPDEFDPDRFLDTDTIRKNPYAYMPFSAGPRNCIGSMYGMVSVKIALAALLRKYRVKTITTAKTAADIRSEVSLLTKPVEGFNVKLSYRNHVDD